MNICVLDAQTLNPGDLSWAALKSLGDVTIYERTEPEMIAKRAGHAEILIVNKVVISRDILDQLPELRFIAVSATGYNNVDIHHAARKGTLVSNAVGYGTDSVAQHVFALILHWTNQTAVHWDAVQSGEWSRSVDFSMYKTNLIELKNKVLGVYGFGKIGQRIADLALAFGMRVLATRSKSGEFWGDRVEFTTLESMLEVSDFISLNAPLTEENLHMVDSEFLSKMKRTAVLINTARGGLVREKDLYNALKQGRIAAACLDVLEMEPPRVDNPLFELQNCIITPHLAWATKEARQRLLDITISNVAAFLEGKPQNIIKPVT